MVDFRFQYVISPLLTIVIQVILGAMVSSCIETGSSNINIASDEDFSTRRIHLSTTDTTEGSISVIRVFLTHPVRNDVTFRVVTNGITATPWEDFVPIDKEVTIPKGHLEATLYFETITDVLMDDYETVGLSLVDLEGVEFGVNFQQVIIREWSPGATAQNVTAVSAGAYHTCFIQDERVKCFGSNGSGVILLGNSGDNRYSPTITKNLDSRPVQIDSYSSHICARYADKKVRCWGDNGYKQADPGSASSWIISLPSLPHQDAIELSLGPDYTCVVTSAKNIVCWGNNNKGEMGNGSFGGPPLPPTTNNYISDARSVSTGNDHACAVLNDSTIKCWGHGLNGRLGNGFSIDAVYDPSSVIGLNGPAVKVSAGFRHTCALLENGVVQCWGSNNNGAIGQPDVVVESNSALTVTLSDLAIDIKTQNDNTCALLESGQLECWGDNTYGVLANGSFVHAYEPIITRGFSERITSFSLSWFHGCAISESQQLYCWGRNDRGQVGTMEADFISQALDVPKPQGKKIIAYQYSPNNLDRAACRVLDDGSISCWGRNRFGLVGNGTNSDTYIASPGTTPIGVSQVTKIAVDNYSFCAVSHSGNLKCWGRNVGGQLGDGNIDNIVATPLTPIGMETDVIDIGMESYTTCALKKSGQVYCWGGLTSYSGLNGTCFPNQLLPNLISGLSNIKSISIGGNVGCAVDVNGKGYCWGTNEQGQLGRGKVDTLCNETPKPVLLDKAIRKISVSPSQSVCALTVGGELYCWGANESGQLGSPPFLLTISAPTKVEGLPSKMVDITTAWRAACATDSLGRLWCWGSNGKHLLGQKKSPKDLSRSSTPVQVTFFAGGIVSLNSAVNHICAITENGSAKCFGEEVRTSIQPTYPRFAYPRWVFDQ